MLDKRIKSLNGDLRYKLKRSARAKRVRITVNCDASIIVTLPKLVNENVAEIFLKEKLDWVIEKVDYFKKNYTGISSPRYNVEDYMKNKARARTIIEEKVFKFNKYYNFEIRKISIRNQKTRWGSCSKKGNLNFNYKLIYLPEKLIDYIVIHELCHLKEFNHSEKFWKLVGRLIPEFKKVRSELKEIIL